MLCSGCEILLGGWHDDDYPEVPSPVGTIYDTGKCVPAVDYVVEGVCYALATPKCTGHVLDTADRVIASACEYPMSLEPVMGKDFHDLVAVEEPVDCPYYDKTSSDTSPDSIWVDGLLSGVIVGEITIK